MTVHIDKTTGQYPISVGTSIALESLVSIDSNTKVSKKPIDNYRYFWINFRTIFRNLYSSLDHSVRDSLLPNQLIILLKDEMSFLKEWCDYDARGIKLVFYCSEYDDLNNLYKFANIRAPRTPIQMHYNNLFNKVLECFVNRKDYSLEYNLRVFKNKIIRPEYNDTVILTSYAYDLISEKSFSKLDLIESHSGKIKPKSLWYTKYLNGNHLYMMPFREDLLQIFGDKSLFSPMSIKITRAIIDIAKKDNWTTLTTTERIKHSINKLNLDRDSMSLIKSIII